ncbi:hypothetical protein M011DRAFT_404281 [Sporormia fimetaria CBS 119925]|uniref:C2H2-type domain-containing protein n=1 Tax=Sporormia fimetaria CBS 119925 TaxID=1340428 RepID=A0A6A6V9V6_9PLEO|nr:hypothetical protein M011DRAFT_404281 [Sporormia fimetaria CBS 119925]
MANNYSGYGYQQSYQQNAGSAQQYSGCQANPATNTSRQQYQQQAAPAAAPQTTDYMASSYPSQSYSNASNTYNANQNVSWGANSYGANRETTRGAAEVLRNISSTAYNQDSSPAVTQSAYSASLLATLRYSNASPVPAAQQQHQQQQQQQPQQSLTANSLSYSQSQAQPRPRSVNANPGQTANRGVPSPAVTAGYPSQRAQNLYNQQPRSVSPAQPQYRNNTTTPVATSRASGAASSQYTNYGQRLPSVNNVAATNTAPPQSNTLPISHASVTAAYSYAETPASSSTVQPTATSSSSEQYNQGTVTVDPMAVYNPWQEYQRQQQKDRQEKAEEDALRAEEERQAEERQTEQRRRGEERLKEEEQQRKEEERKKAEEEERAREAAKAKKQSQAKHQKQKSTASTASANTGESSGGQPAELEAEIRAMMAKMRELNSKDPALLARIWEEERRAKAPKSPTVQAQTPQPAVAQPATARPAAAQPAPAAARTTSVPPAPSGTTLWPPEKKTQLVAAAREYLSAHNPGLHIGTSDIMDLLNDNPSYIELCELLEARNAEVDRAAFAKALLTAVPDINGPPSRPQASYPVRPAVGTTMMRPPPAAVMQHGSAHAHPATRTRSPSTGSSFPPFPGSPSADSAPVAQMIPLKAELKPPANKEEAARKRSLNELVDLTALSDEELQPLAKRQNVGDHWALPGRGSNYPDAADVEFGDATPTRNFPMTNNFPVVQARVPPPAQVVQAAPPAPPPALRTQKIVEPLEKKKALRRNTYNIKTIARDVLLACGRHPDERALNQHLEILKTSLPNAVNNDVDLSTLRWDIIDPGEPPKGYYRDLSQAVAEDADDEDDSDDDAERQRRQARASGIPHATGGAVNPFKRGRGRGRPRHSYPDDIPTQTPPRRSTTSNMSASAPRPTAAGLGYSAFRAATEYGPDGQPLPKKKGRPVGWRKAIHGSAAALARPAPNGHTGPRADSFAPAQPSALRNVRSGNEEPITIPSRSSSVSRMPRYESFPCKWHNCSADLHNLETLKKHVHKVHRKQTLRGTLECHWGNCKRNDGSGAERPFSFVDEAQWREHLEIRHFKPLSWELGDGPASGLSDTNEADAYLSDAQGRRVTPRISVAPSSSQTQDGSTSTPGKRRGRPTKAEQQARESQGRLVAQKKRLGAPGMDRGGATLVNDKRRRGFSDDDHTEEEVVDVETWGIRRGA